MIFHRQTRTLKNSTETTQTTSTIGSDTLAFNLQTTDEFYVGFREKFKTRYVFVDTANASASVLSVKYWDGSDYTAVEDLIDLTNSGGVTMAQSGFVSWQNLTDWVKTADPTESGSDTMDVELYWTEWTVSVNLDAGTKIRALINCWTDEEQLRMYYPELVTDTNYLPSGRTDFLEQYNAATQLVALRLIQANAITDISQVIEPNQVMAATTHAAAYVILNGIPNKSDELIEAKNDALDSMNMELAKARDAFDVNNTGEITDAEREIAPRYVPRT